MDALRGIALLWRTPRLWGLAVGPLLAVLGVYGLLGVAGAVWLLPHISEWLGGVPGGAWIGRLGEVAIFVLYLFAFPLFFTLLGGVFFGLIFEPLSQAIERIVADWETEATRAVGQIAPRTRTKVTLPLFVSLGDSLARLVLNGVLGLVAFVLGFALGPLPGVVTAAIVGLLDYTAPAFLRQGITLGPQARRLLLRLNAASLSFGLVAGLLSLVPFLGVLLMPGLIAGGTLLTLRHEGERGLPTL